MALEYPKALKKSDWDKNKGLLNKIGTPDTGVGELLKKLETAFGQVNWEALDKKKAMKDAKQDFDKFELAYHAAKGEATKGEKVADLLDEIVTAANKHKSKIKQCGVVADEAKTLKTEVGKLTFLDWDDERITLREAKEELEWYIDARANALKVAKDLRREFEKDVKTAKDMVGDIEKALDDIQNADIDDEARGKLFRDMTGWVETVVAFDVDDTKEFNKEFAQNKDVMAQRGSPKHDIKDELNAAGGDFNLQMTEVDAIQKALTQLETLAASASGMLEEAQDVVDADSRSVGEWKTSLNKTIKDLTNIVKATRDAREKLDGKARKSEESHLPFMRDKNTTPEQKTERKRVIPALVKEVRKQYDTFLSAAAQFDSKAKRAEKVPEEVANESVIKPMLAAFNTLKKLVAVEREAAEKSFNSFNKNMEEVLTL